MFQSVVLLFTISCVLYFNINAFDLKGFDDTILYKLNWGVEADNLLVKDT